MTKTLYTTSAVSTGDGRAGHVRSVDGILDLDLAYPKEFGGEGGDTNPEQLFAGGYAACFHSAMKLVATRERIKFAESSVTATVSIHPTDSGGFKLSVILHVQIKGLALNEATALVEKAHQVCPYSNAVRGNIEVTLETSVV